MAKTTEECTFSMAAEGRHKFPSILGTAGEERHKSLLSLALNLCSIGGGTSPSPMTSSTGLSEETLGLAEAYGVGFQLLSVHSWSFNTSMVLWAVLVHSSDLGKAHPDTE